MAARKKARKRTATAKSTASPAANARGVSSNGLRAFSMHMLDKASAPIMAELRKEREMRPAFALTTPAALPRLDPETAARRYLDQALESKAVPALTAPAAGGAESDF